MLSYIETHITEACNLRCRGCSHFSGLAKPNHKDLVDFKHEMKRLAEIEQIGTIRLMGGEPLLNPKFMDYLYITRRYFPYSNIALVTNGILADRLLPYRAALVDLDIDVTMSDYHINIQDKSILSKLPYTELHDKAALYNISLDPSGSRDAANAFAACDIQQNKWLFLKDGRLYPCCIAGTIHDFWDHFGLDWGISPEDMSIDIFEHDAAEIEAFLSQPIKLCKYCATDIRPHTYRPFEKSKGEITEWTI